MTREDAEMLLRECIYKAEKAAVAYGAAAIYPTVNPIIYYAAIAAIMEASSLKDASDRIMSTVEEVGTNLVLARCRELGAACHELEHEKLYRHVTFNPTMRSLEEIIREFGATDTPWRLVGVVPYTAYESVAVFERLSAATVEREPCGSGNASIRIVPPDTAA
jgi:hypothetical protein